jgi:hypothetical protein
MTEAAASDAPAVERERGWWPVVIATIALLFLPTVPGMRLFLPAEHTLVLVVTALAACAIAGWWAGGRIGLATLWTMLAGWVVWRESQVGTYSLLLAGWAVVLGAAFGAMSLRRVTGAPPFFARALSATGLALLIAGGTTLAVPGGLTQTRAEAEGEFARRTDVALQNWSTMTSTPDWKEWVKAHPEADSLSSLVTAQIQATPAASVTLFPAMLALESLAALALAWALYHRVGRARLGPPLAALRDFRFSDQLVWGLVAGLALVVVPGFSPIRAVGANLLMFFGAIYALRGMGVALYFLAPGRWLMVLLVGFTLLFYNVVGVLALVLGLGDTWLDWRRRARPKT